MSTTNAVKAQIELNEDERNTIDALLYESMQVKSGRIPHSVPTLTDSQKTIIRERLAQSFPRAAGAGQRSTSNE